MARVESGWSAESSFTTEEEVVEPPPVDPPPPGTGELDIDGLVGDGGYYLNFADYPLGVNGDWLDANTELAAMDGTSSTVDAPYGYNGGTKRCLKSYVHAGQEDYGTWGYVVESSSKVMSINIGGEMWFRTCAYYPSGYDWDTPGAPALKFLRTFRVSNDSPESEGACETSIIPDGRIVIGNERQSPEPPDYWVPADGGGDGKWYRTTGQLTHGTWHMVESYTKFDDTPWPNQKGVRKIWFDGKFVGSSSSQTMPKRDGSGWTPGRHMVHTYWNGGAPRTQYCYLNHTTFAFRGYEKGTQRWVDHTAYMPRDENNFPFLGIKVK